MHEAYLNVAEDLDEQLLLLHNKLITDLIYTILLIITTALNVSSDYYYCYSYHTNIT